MYAMNFLVYNFPKTLIFVEEICGSLTLVVFI